MFGTEWRVVRAMPNTAVTVGEGACTVLYCTVLYCTAGGGGGHGVLPGGGGRAQRQPPGAAALLQRGLLRQGHGGADR